MSTTAQAKIIPLRRPAAGPAPDSLTVDAAIALTLAASRAQGCAVRTVELYEKNLGRFGVFCRARGLVLLRDVDADDLTAFFGDLLAGGLARSTVASAAIPVKKLFSLAERRGRLDVNPWRRGAVSVPKPDSEIEPAFTEAELSQLLWAAAGGLNPERDVTLLLFLLDTGLRAAELCALRVGDIGADGRVLVRVGKGGKTRLAFIGPDSLAAWRRYPRSGCKPDEPAFTSWRRNPFTVHDLRDLLKRLEGRSGVANVHPHRFRKTFAVTMLRAGADVVRLRRLMGHAAGSDVLERFYLPLAESDLESLHNTCGPVARLYGSEKSERT